MDTGWITEDMWLNPAKEGYMGLLTSPPFSKKKTKEKQYYFRLKGKSLIYFDDEVDKTPIGHIPLKDMILKNDNDQYAEEVFVVESTVLGKKFYLKADSISDKKLWCNALTDAANSGISLERIPAGRREFLLKDEA